MAIYNEKLGELTRDNLIADINVKQVITSGTIASGQGNLKRGTVLALSSGKLVIMNTGLEPYGILCDAVDATAADAVGEVYVAGQFNKNALIVKSGYTMTTEDVQKLRNGGIYIENVM